MWSLGDYVEKLPAGIFSIAQIGSLRKEGKSTEFARLEAMFAIGWSLAPGNYNFEAISFPYCSVSRRKLHFFPPKYVESL